MEPNLSEEQFSTQGPLRFFEVLIGIITQPTKTIKSLKDQPVKWITFLFVAILGSLTAFLHLP